MEMLILFAGSGLILGLTFVGTWLLRGNGLGELWPWGQPAGPTTEIPGESNAH